MDTMKTINNTRRNKILLLNTADELTGALSRSLDSEQYQLVAAGSPQEALDLSNDTDFCLAIVGDATSAGEPTLKRLNSSYPWMEIIVVLSTDDIDKALEFVRAGIHDCLTSANSTEECIMRVKKALRHGQMKQELTSLRQHVAMSYGFDNIVGSSRPITKLKDTLKRIAPTDISVMLYGPIGSGKELVARVVHHHSHRRKNPFVTVDCSSIPEGLFEAELFGEVSEPNASTPTGKKGLLMEANGGTIFFDDVDRIPPSVQPRLMNFLRDFTVRTTPQALPIKLDVRIISASSVKLASLVDEGCFSRELFYQLSVLPLELPSLSERPEDIEMLSEYFLRRLAHEMKRPYFEVTRNALDLLISHRWPGNVRELENTLKRAAALCRENRIDADDILFISTDGETLTVVSQSETPAMPHKTGRLDEGQRSIIIKALAENNWNFTQTAQELGIGRTTLWRKVKKYKLEKEKVTQ